jgi:tetratricopeptide (TPR) repeat protein
LVEQALNPAPPVGAKGHGPAPETSPDGKLLQQGDEAAHAGKWKQALEFYETLTRKYPGGDPAFQALSASAAIYEAKLGRKDKAEVLRQELVRRREQRMAKATGPGADRVALFKQAGELAAAGQTEKAIEAYQRFLAQPVEGVAPGTRLLARYRLGGLFEKAGQKDKAAEAYRAVLDMAGDDEYSLGLKKKARENMGRLGVASQEKSVE